MNKQNTKETTKIEGKFYNSKHILSIAALLCGFSLIYSIKWGSKWGHSLAESIEYGYFSPFFFFGLPLLVIAVVVYYWIGQCAIVVTDKRVYGKVAFGKQVDLPIDLISSVAKVKIFSAIAVSTSSGVIRFSLVKNAEDVFNAISELLKERQSKIATPTVQTTIKQEISQSNADELKKFKELLDMGIISQEEFDEKKKQLLGL